MQSNNDGLAWRERLSPALFLYPLAHLGVELYNNVLAIMWPLLAGRFGLGYGAVGLLTMIFRGSMTLPQLGFASLCDRYGSRLLGIWGLAWMAAGMSLVGLAPNVAVLAAILALAPLGSAAFHPAGTAYMSRAMPRRRGLAVAIFMIGGTLGSALAPLLGAALFEGRGLSVSPRLMPLGLAIALTMVFLIPADRRPAARPEGAVAAPRAPIPRVVLLLMVATVSVAWLENGLILYLPLLMTGRGLPLTAASRVLSVYAAAAAGGVLLGGVLSDRIPRWRVMLLALMLSGPLYAGTLLLEGHLTLLLAAGLGFGSALSHPTSVAMAQEIMPDRTSLAAALTMGLSWVQGSLGAALTGVLADRIGVQEALLVNTVLPVAGIVAMLAVYRASKAGRGAVQARRAVP